MRPHKRLDLAQRDSGHAAQRRRLCMQLGGEGGREKYRREVQRGKKGPDLDMQRNRGE